MEADCARKQRGFGGHGYARTGLMGRGIAACLLCHGRKVGAPHRGRAEKARTFLAGVMEEVVRRGVFPAGAVADWAERFTVVDAISGLAESPFVVESVKEDIELKRRLYAELEKQIAPDAVIASNTSSFPLTLLQAESVHPARFVVMHWAEPTWITRFMEIVRNGLTSEGRGSHPERRPGVRQAAEFPEFRHPGFANLAMYR